MTGSAKSGAKVSTSIKRLKAEQECKSPMSSCTEFDTGALIPDTYKQEY